MKKRILGLAVCAVVLLSFAACGGTPVATVNGVDISQAEYEDYMNYTLVQYQQMYQQYGMEFTVDSSMKDDLMDTCVDSLISMELTKQACEDADVAPSDEEISEYAFNALGVTTEDEYNEYVASVTSYYGISQDTFEKLISSECYNGKLKEYMVEYANLSVSDKEAKKTYKDNPEGYDNRTVSHILIKPEVAEGRTAETDENGNTIYTDEEWAAAKSEAEALIKELDNGADFAELAEENSDDTATAVNGGALGESFTVQGSTFVEEFTKASFKLNDVGQYTEKPVKSSYGYHIILCTGIQDSEHDFDSLLDTIKDELLSAAEGDALTGYLDEFKANADIKYYIGSRVSDGSEEEEQAPVVEEATDSELDAEE